MGAGVGLAGMRERVREIGGMLEITSEGSATRVEVVVPLERTEESTQKSGPSLPEESRLVGEVPIAPARSDIEGMLFGPA